jgi:hypothetical protein
MKQTWNKPQLVVLVSGKSEEAVLVACKTGQSPNPGPSLNGSPGTYYQVCTQEPVGSGLAYACSNCESLLLS